VEQYKFGQRGVGYGFAIYQRARKVSDGLGTINSVSHVFDAEAVGAWKGLQAQGLTLKQVVLNLERKDHSPGLLYVAISRVKRLSSIMFETPFDLSRFTTVVLCSSIRGFH
jgi:hypothetical protein